jgi:parallel beta-helix repeat protein
LTARCLVLVGALCATIPNAASASTFWVSPSGSDASVGTERFPFRTIGRAAASARSGDTVVVSAGRYRETVSLSPRQTGVTFRGAGDAQPVLDGGGRRAFGFENVGADRLTIENFEITGQRDAAVYTSGSEVQVLGNLIHHVGAASEPENAGVRVVRSRAARIAGNTIHHVGPGRSSFGIWLHETRDSLVEDNAVYFIRKEGIRDWIGLDNTIARNRAFLNWAGIALNTSTGTLVTDNHVHDNVEGFAVKHVSYRTVLEYWGLDQAHWSRLTHNTVSRSSEASLWIAQSGEPLDYVAVRHNRFSGAGGAFLRDVPSLRGPHVTVDQNAYSDAGGDPRWLYKAGWSSGEGLTDWESVREQTGWEATAPEPGAGAAPIAAAPVSWTPLGMTPVASSSKGTYWTRAHLDDTSDGDQSTYWITSTNRNEYVVFDFGEPRTFDHLILTLHSHDDKRNPRGYRFAVSNDRASWQTVASGINQDTSGSARYYELPQPVTGRFLRFTMVDTFCDRYIPRLGCAESFVLSDLTAGMLGPPSTTTPEPVPVEPPPDEPKIAVAPRAVLTQEGKLRIRVRCAGSLGGRARFVVRPRLGRKRVALGPDCRRSVEISLRRRFVRRVRRGGVRAVRLTYSAPGTEPVTTRLRVRP